MSFEVYDYRKDIRNLLVTPQIRARFIRLEVGSLSGGDQRGKGHSHDLGHEIFLVLQGKAEFEIEGEVQVLEPGQMCVALVDEIHTVRNVGDEPVIIYLSVTPHIQPTHTSWVDEGTKAPLHFNSSGAWDIPNDQTTPINELVESQQQAADALMAVVESAYQVQCKQLSLLAGSDKEAALEARDKIWKAIYPMFQQMYELADSWNSVTYRTADTSV
ncbi:MAG: cupin domain-containing protein [Candidatus Poribacteria bacterium]|nr:cupin domain-containing protein [Candidatus Poribacteria bacterium]